MLIYVQRSNETQHNDAGNQTQREASVMTAMYEKKLALQAESYMQLKIAYEELTQVRQTAVCMIPLAIPNIISYGRQQ